MDTPPPLSLAYPTFVLEYAVVDVSVEYTGRQKLNVNGEWLGEVPKLAITKNYKTGKYHLSHCNEEWDELCSVQSRGSVREIKTLAAERYRGIDSKWRQTGYEMTDAIAAHEQEKIEYGCSFCGKSPYEGEMLGFVRSEKANICSECLKYYAEKLNERTT